MTNLKNATTNTVKFGNYAICLQKEQLSYYHNGDLTKVNYTKGTQSWEIVGKKVNEKGEFYAQINDQLVYFITNKFALLFKFIGQRPQIRFESNSRNLSTIGFN